MTAPIDRAQKLLALLRTDDWNHVLQAASIFESLVAEDRAQIETGFRRELDLPESLVSIEIELPLEMSEFYRARFSYLIESEDEEDEDEEDDEELRPVRAMRLPQLVGQPLPPPVAPTLPQHESKEEEERIELPGCHVLTGFCEGTLTVELSRIELAILRARMKELETGLAQHLEQAGCEDHQKLLTLLVHDDVVHNQQGMELLRLVGSRESVLDESRVADESATIRQIRAVDIPRLENRASSMSIVVASLRDDYWDSCEDNKQKAEDILYLRDGDGLFIPYPHKTYGSWYRDLSVEIPANAVDEDWKSFVDSDGDSEEILWKASKGFNAEVCTVSIGDRVLEPSEVRSVLLALALLDDAEFECYPRRGDSEYEADFESACDYAIRDILEMGRTANMGRPIQRIVGPL